MGDQTGHNSKYHKAPATVRASTVCATFTFSCERRVWWGKGQALWSRGMGFRSQVSHLSARGAGKSLNSLGQAFPIHTVEKGTAPHRAVRSPVEINTPAALTAGPARVRVGLYDILIRAHRCGVGLGHIFISTVGRSKESVKATHTNRNTQTQTLSQRNASTQRHRAPRTNIWRPTDTKTQRYICKDTQTHTRRYTHPHRDTDTHTHSPAPSVLQSGHPLAILARSLHVCHVHSALMTILERILSSTPSCRDTPFWPLPTTPCVSPAAAPHDPMASKKQGAPHLLTCSAAPPHVFSEHPCPPVLLFQKYRASLLKGKRRKQSQVLASRVWSRCRYCSLGGHPRF